MIGWRGRKPWSGASCSPVSDVQTSTEWVPENRLATSPYAALFLTRRTSRTTMPAGSDRCGSPPVPGEPAHRDDAADGNLDEEAEHPEKNHARRGGRRLGTERHQRR